MLKLYNSLTREYETVEPINKDKVGIYTCGPTVYSYVTVGNWRTYVLGDLVVRTMKYLNYEVDYVMNITDVGHLTGDNLGDADSGEDRMEKGAAREGKSAWDIAEFYTEDFIEGFNKLNMVEPKKFVKATDHIQEQVDLVKRIEEAGFTYQIEDGVYFDVQAYEQAGNTYGELSTLDEIQAGARVSMVEGKKDPRDFALWKFSGEEKRQMEWDSPWGKGFPGWHIECSAMSMKYLGDQFDIHVGGEDLRSTHHPNEIAQSEAVTGKKPFVKYWMHGAFLQVDGGRMGKSLGNAYTLQDVEAQGVSTLGLRYFYLTGHYRQPLNFTWEGVRAAQKTLDRLYEWIRKAKESVEDMSVGDTSDLADSEIVMTYTDRFNVAVGNDLNMPEAVAVVWKLVKDDEAPLVTKLKLLEIWDGILGLSLTDVESALVDIPPQIQELVTTRDRVRDEKNWKEADRIREEIEKLGYEIEDSVKGVRVRKR